MGRIIGIDLGTTNSLVAVPSSDGPRILTTPRGSDHVPSAVAMDRNLGLVIGEQARQLAELGAGDAILSAKRQMGSDCSYQLGGESLRPQDVAALLLREQRRVAEAALEAPVDRAVVSVPAYFNDVQRRAVQEAGALADLRIERLISEPTAAALAYGLDKLEQDGSLVVVYDLGGGTFDVSVLELFEGIFSVRSCNGDSRLGGDDFDARLMEWVEEQVGPQLGGRQLAPRGRAHLRSLAQELKLRLSDEQRVSVETGPLAFQDGSNGSVLLRLDREGFEQRTRDLLERAAACVARSLSDAGVTRADVQEVVLVGGSTRMPMVRAQVEELFGRPPNISVDPMRAVALGAAIQAGWLSGGDADDNIIVTDVSPFTLGVAVVGEHAGEWRAGVFSPLIHRNATLPVQCTQQFQTSHPEQDTVCIEVYQGDDPVVENNIFIDKYFLGGLPKKTGHLETIEVTFEYDIDGILQVRAVITATGKSAGIRIDGRKLRATGATIVAVRGRLDGFWDRSLPARVLGELLERGEQRLATTSAASHDVPPTGLEDLLSAARRALAAGDSAKIERFIAELRLVLDADGPDGN